MSHNIDYYTYPESCNREKVFRELDAYVRHSDWQEGGSLGAIRWLESAPVCDSYEDARKYIESHDRGWYDCLAVRYRANSDKKDASLDKITAAISEAREKYNQANSAFHFEHTTSAFIGCKNCGSKIAHAFLHSNFCPVCKADLRPQTTLATIARYQEKVDNLCEQKEARQKELAKKYGKVMWLVKIEYHT